jgi:hypothetical protein
LALSGLGFFFALGVKGFGGVLSIRASTASRELSGVFDIMPIHYKHRPYLPPKNHLAAIGAIAAIWTAIESTMETTILALYEIDMGRGLVLTANIGFHPRMALLRILGGERVHMTEAQAQELMQTKPPGIISRLDDGYGDRNALVHGLWGPTDKPGIIRRMSVRARGKKLQANSQHYSAEDLWAVSDRLAELLREFVEWGDRVGVVKLLAEAPQHSKAPQRRSTSK